MHQIIKKKTKIHSTGIYLPSEIVKSDDIFSEIKSETQYGIATNWMSEKMGIVERRVAPSDAKPSDLAIPYRVRCKSGSTDYAYTARGYLASNCPTDSLVLGSVTSSSHYYRDTGTNKDYYGLIKLYLAAPGTAEMITNPYADMTDATNPRAALFTYSDMADDVVQLMDHFHVQRAHIAGDWFACP